jgi:hypothetical protein
MLDLLVDHNIPLYDACINCEQPMHDGDEYHCISSDGLCNDCAQSVQTILDEET